RDVRELARRACHQVHVQDEGVVEKAVDPYPARPVRQPLVEGELELPGRDAAVALAPEVELVGADDEDHAQDKVDDVLVRWHRVHERQRRLITTLEDKNRQNDPAAVYGGSGSSQP